MKKLNNLSLNTQQLIQNLINIYNKFEYNQDSLDDMLNYYLEDKHIQILKEEFGDDWDIEIIKYF